MVEKFIIKEMLENENSFVISSGEKNYEIKKADLNTITLGVGDKVEIFEHPNFPGIVARLDINGHCVFQKLREKIVDERLRNEERLLYGKIPQIAKERIKMFSMFMEGFHMCNRLFEIIALYLGYKLYSEHREKIDVFARLSFDDQKIILPGISHPILPQIPAKTIVKYAKAYLHDENLNFKNRDDILQSALMSLPAQKDSNPCKPSRVWIEKYLATTRNS